MTPRERWLALLNGQPYDRVPLSYRSTPEFTEKLMDYLQVESRREMFERLHIDPVLTVAPEYVGPPLDPDTDVFAIGYQHTDYGTGKYRDAVYHPLAEYETVSEIEANYEWPDPEWWDYSTIPSQIEGKEEWVIRGGMYEEFATYKFLRGVQRAY
ncbi:MAG: uroporphyrinogen-III decarboxylase-like protein, partial [Armatimonadota bacterium]